MDTMTPKLSSPRLRSKHRRASHAPAGIWLGGARLEGVRSYGLVKEVVQLKKQVAALTKRLAEETARTSGDVAGSGAAKALADLRGRLNAEAPLVVDSSFNAADVSEAVKHEWITCGRLIGWKDLSDAWGGRSRQSLDQAANRFELVNLKVKGRLWYPADFRVLPADAVKSVCQVLRGVDPVSQMIFWARPHGALEGHTLAHAIKNGQLHRVIQLAQAFAEETVGHVAQP